MSWPALDVCSEATAALNRRLLASPLVRARIAYLGEDYNVDGRKVSTTGRFRLQVSVPGAKPTLVMAC
jgi:hypothetical protein